MRRLTTEEFISKAKTIHGNKYDYSLCVYEKSSSKVKIVCKKHGVFEQTPCNHLHLKHKQGCPVCGGTKKQNTNNFIEKAKERWNNDYDYSLSEYKTSKTKLKIICKLHGIFEKSPYHHLYRNQGCPSCSNEKASEISRFSKKELLEKLKAKNNYKYDLTLYKSQKSKIPVVCDKHGEFSTTVGSLLMGTGCPTCAKGKSSSKAELEILNFLSQYTQVESSLNITNSNMELDIFLPKKRIAIEFNGLYYHSTKFITNKKYHLEKTLLCKNQDIQLIHIFEDEWLLKPEIVKSRLLHIIGKSKEKIYARVCKTKEVSSKEAMEFLNENHIQGKVGGHCYIGLYFDNELVSIMTFSKSRVNLGNYNKNEWELQRFCNKKYTTVIGGASKLLKYFEKTKNPINIISYADIRWSKGDLYQKLAFIHTHNSPPNYFYKINNRRKNRYNYRKSVLIKEGYDENKSESQIMKERGIYKIYDCGTMVFRKQYSEKGGLV